MVVCKNTNTSCITDTTNNTTIDAVSDDINNMNISNNNIASTGVDSSISMCANCGKEGTNINNTCNKCKQVKYCNAACKKKHRSKHKKACEEHIRLSAEHAAEVRDEKLFKQPPPQWGDCPICFQRIPTLNTGRRYQTCCGKIICCGCSHAPVYDDQGNEVDNEKCPFCRIPTPYTDEEGNEREKKRMEANDAEAIFNVGTYCYFGANGFPQDYTKALELFHRAAELDYATAYNSIGYAYDFGQGVEIDKKKAVHYYELAANGGNEIARYNLGINEQEAGNIDRALKHHMIAVRDGYTISLEQIKLMYSNGDATKGDYTKALQLYQTYLGEIKSPQRDKAAAYSEKYRYC